MARIATSRWKPPPISRTVHPEVDPRSHDPDKSPTRELDINDLVDYVQRTAATSYEEVPLW